VAEASKHANTALFTEIQTLEAYKRTDTDSATVDNFNQQYQTLHTATNTHMASYEGLNAFFMLSPNKPKRTLVIAICLSGSCCQSLKFPPLVLAIATLLIDFMSTISVQGTLVKARLSIEKSTISP
jgi:hypothetical protein